MSIVSRAERSRDLEQHYPILFKLCVANALPEILTYRMNADLPFCYGATAETTLIPSDWDSEDVRVVPLWESGSSLTALRRISGETDFVQINYEDPNDVEVLAKSVEGLFTYLFFFLVESVGEGDGEEFSEIEQLASYLGFEKLGMVVDLVKRVSSESDYESLFEVTRGI